MKHQFKVSGKKFLIDDRAKESLSLSKTSLRRRPGGWIVLEQVSEDGRVERIRGMAAGHQSRLSVQWFQGDRLVGPFFGELSRLQVGTSSASVSGASGGASDLTAQFPGKVRKILVQSGEQVTEGQKLILVEAMKMEFSIQAPSAGQVKRVLVTEGQQLSPGVLMIDFEGT